MKSIFVLESVRDIGDERVPCGPQALCGGGRADGGMGHSPPPRGI